LRRNFIICSLGESQPGGAVFYPDAAFRFVWFPCVSPYRRHNWLTLPLFSQSTNGGGAKRLNMLTSCYYEFIKPYLTCASAGGTVDVASKSVYAAAATWFSA